MIQENHVSMMTAGCLHLRNTSYVHAEGVSEKWNRESDVHPDTISVTAVTNLEILIFRVRNLF